MAESEFADHQTSRTTPGTSAAEWTLSTVRCCPAKLAAALSSSTADDRTANGADGLDQVARERHTRRHREALARGVAEPHRLRPIERCLARLGDGDDLLHPSTVTSPASPSTRTRTPSAMRPVASRVPTTPGMPYSRETIAACESRPPLSVTIPPSSGRRMLKASVVEAVTSTSPFAMRPNSEGPETRRAGPSYTPLLAARPWRTFSSCCAW